MIKNLPNIVLLNKNDTTVSSKVRQNCSKAGSIKLREFSDMEA
jgi:hypothetical protein